MSSPVSTLRGVGEVNAKRLARLGVETIREFYTPFAVQVARAEELMPEVKTGPEPIGRACPDCGMELVIRWGRYGKFISCSGFPNCDFTSWKLPLPTACPACKGLLVMANKNQAQCLQCEEIFPLDQVTVDESATVG